MAGASLEPPTLAQAARPNLVIVLVDDVGYNDVGWRNSYAKTPFLDGLLRNGSEPTVELLRHYTFSICSPTRSSLLTGRLPSHVNEFNHGAEFPEWKNSAVGGPPVGGIDLRMRLLPQLLKGAGYRTAHVGKWHLGSSQFAQTPSRRGFDESFGYLSGSMHTHLTHLIDPDHKCNDTWKPGVDLWENETPIREHYGVHSCELFATRAVRIIQRHDPTEPLFLYAAMAEAHGPYDEVPRHRAGHCHTYKCRRLRSYRGMIACADEATQNITDALRRQGMWANTLMLWSSDNGATREMGSNAPFRGHKNRALEGGVRVAALLAGGALPHTAPPKYEGLVHVADWFATFAALAGIDDPSDPAAVQHGLPDVDSINLWPSLTGASGSDGRTEVLLGTDASLCVNAALIQGDWKLISRVNLLKEADEPDANTEDRRLDDQKLREITCPFPEDFALFNLADDPYEQDDVSQTHPDTHKRLHERYRELAANAYQTGVTEAYMQPGEVVSGPYAEACGLAKHAAEPGSIFVQNASYRRP